MSNTGFLSARTTSAAWEGESNVSEMTISAVRARTKPKYDVAARELLDACRAFYEDPENEKTFQDWKAERGAR